MTDGRPGAADITKEFSAMEGGSVSVVAQDGLAQRTYGLEVRAIPEAASSLPLTFMLSIVMFRSPADVRRTLRWLTANEDVVVNAYKRAYKVVKGAS